MYIISVHQIQTTLISSTLTRLYNFVNEDQEKDLIIRLNVQQFSNNKTCKYPKIKKKEAFDYVLFFLFE